MARLVFPAVRHVPVFLAARIRNFGPTAPVPSACMASPPVCGWKTCSGRCCKTLPRVTATAYPNCVPRSMTSRWPSAGQSTTSPPSLRVRCTRYLALQLSGEIRRMCASPYARSPRPATAAHRPQHTRSTIEPPDGAGRLHTAAIAMASTSCERRGDGLLRWPAKARLHVPPRVPCVRNLNGHATGDSPEKKHLKMPESFDRSA